MTTPGSRSSYDPMLFSGTASYYARYRPAYPAALFKHLTSCFLLDGRGRALDLGCGTGQLTIPLAPYFEQVVGIDPDEEMLKEAEQFARRASIATIQFIQGSSWDVTPALGSFRLITMGESFHWMDREEILRTLYSLLLPAGGVVIVSRTYQPPEGYERVKNEVVTAFLGEKRRAGQGYYTHPEERHEAVLARSPFTVLDPWQIEEEQVWSIEQILGFLFSTSYASKYLLGEQVGAFEEQLRKRLLQISPQGTFLFRIKVTALLGQKG